MTFKAYQYESPLAGLSEKELSKLRTDVGKKQEKIYQESLDRIIKLLTEYNPLSLLATLSFYGLTTTTGKNDEFKKKNPILQHHIEIIQTIFLTSDPSKIGLNIPDSNVVQEMFDLGRKVTQGFFLKRIKDIPTDENISHIQTIEDIRVHTQSVRNPTYPKQWHKINHGVFTGVNKEFKEIFGIESTALYDTLMDLVCLIESRISIYFRKLKSVGSKKNSNDLIDEFLHQFPEMGYKKEDILIAKKIMNVRDKDMKYFIMQYSDPYLMNCYKLNISDLKKYFPSGVTDSQIINIFDQLSYKVGDLNNIDKGLIFMNNPIWEKPVIKINELTYYWPLPSLIFSFSLRMFEGLMSGHIDLIHKYELSRSSFLENEIDKLFNKYFHDAQIFRGSKWIDDGKEYENDLTIILENYMLVVEAKSGKVTDSARRGSALRLKKEINKILVEPAKQARRFESHLIQSKRLHEFNNKSGNVNRIDTTNITYHECVTVCLEQFGKLNTSWKLLEKASFIDDEVKLTPSIFLGDLYIIFDALEGPSSKNTLFI